MNSWFGTAAFFFAIAMWRLVEVEPVWWSIVTVVILFVASGAALARGIVDRRRRLVTAEE
ncbi:hypothetical protein [Microbacterium sp. ProA8]|uniref:hypothetical protein n=1 Tax=Microbacterium chionoecetis TaxID=3153754 RepID=UPI003267BB2E